MNNPILPGQQQQQPQQQCEQQQTAFSFSSGMCMPATSFTGPSAGGRNYGRRISTDNMETKPPCAVIVTIFGGIYFIERTILLLLTA